MPETTKDEPFHEFQIENLSMVSYGRVMARFDLCIGGAIIQTNLVASEAGVPAFCKPTSIKDAYSKSYLSTVKFDRNLAASVLEAVCARLAADETPAPATTAPAARPAVKGTTEARSVWAADQERKFDEAFDELETA